MKPTRCLLLIGLLLASLSLAACGKKSAPVWRDSDGQPVTAPQMPN